MYWTKPHFKNISQGYLVFQVFSVSLVIIYLSIYPPIYLAPYNPMHNVIIKVKKLSKNGYDS